MLLTPYRVLNAYECGTPQVIEKDYLYSKSQLLNADWERRFFTEAIGSLWWPGSPTFRPVVERMSVLKLICFPDIVGIPCEYA